MMFKSHAILPLLLAIFTLWAALPANADDSSAIHSGNVLEWLKENKAAPGLKPNTHVPLQPQWIGMITRVVSRDPDKIQEKDKPDPMRLNALWRDSQGRVVIARSGKYGLVGSDAAIYQKELPSLSELKKATKVSELRHWFGPQHGWTDVWGDGKNDHWSEGWTYFTTTKDGRLRWLNVFALEAGPRDAKEGVGEIESLTVREGFFRIANPTSEKEKRAYPSAEALEAGEEAGRERERAKIPQPLRTLVAARQKQGDSDLRAYTETINAIRRDPQPELFAQMAERIDDGTCVMQGMVEDVLCDHSTLPRSATWDPKKKQLALRHAAAAIDHVTNPNSLEEWAELLLQALGGGHLQPKTPDGEIWIDMKVKIEGDSKTLTLNGNRITKKNLGEAKRAVREEFVREFPILKP